MAKLLNAAEQSALLMSAYSLQSEKDGEKFLNKVERILLDKMHAQNETERAIALRP